MTELFNYIEDSTSRKLMQTLSHLMETSPFDEISTSDIIRSSGVSRSTFYRRYRDKYDLVNTSYQLLLDRTIDRIPQGYSFKEAFYTLYTVLKSAPSFFKNALSSRDANSLRNYIYRKSYEMYNIILSAQGIDISAPYFRMLLDGCVGTVEITCRWAENGMQEPLELCSRPRTSSSPTTYKYTYRYFARKMTAVPKNLPPAVPGKNRDL